MSKSRISVNIKTNTSRRDIVDTTTYNPTTDEENPDILLKILCGAINRRIDNLAISPDECSHSPALDPLNTVSTPAFHSSETSAQSDGSYIAPALARISASVPITPGNPHDNATDDDDERDEVDDAEVGCLGSYILTIRKTSPTMSPYYSNEGNLKLTQQKAEPHKVPEAREPPPKPARTYPAAYLKAVAVVLLACFMLYFVGSYH